MWAAIVKAILDWLLSQVGVFLGTFLKLWKADQDAQKANDELQKKLEESKTEEEQQDATDDLADRLRGRK